MPRLHLWINLIAASAIMVACAPAAASSSAMLNETPLPPSATPMAEAMLEATATTTDAATASALSESQTAASSLPQWMGISLTNVTTGEQFRLADFQGKVVLIEPMAVWCTKCRALQQEIVKLRQELGDQASELVVVSLDVDPYEDAPYLRAYVDQTGFDWAFAIAPVDLSRALSEAYGDQFLNPPSTPLLIIDRLGAAQLLPFGPKSAADVLAALQRHLDDGL